MNNSTQSTPPPTTTARQENDAELYLRARKHMEQWSMAASLARPLWDAVVREHDRHAAESKALSAQLIASQGESERLREQMAGEDAELAVLRETIKAIEAVNVDEFGGKADLAISRLIESVPQAIAARLSHSGANRGGA